MLQTPAPCALQSQRALKLVSNFQNTDDDESDDHLPNRSPVHCHSFDRVAATQTLTRPYQLFRCSSSLPNKSIDCLGRSSSQTLLLPFDNDCCSLVEKRERDAVYAVFDTLVSVATATTMRLRDALWYIAGSISATLWLFLLLHDSGQLRAFEGTRVCPHSTFAQRQWWWRLRW